MLNIIFEIYEQKIAKDKMDELSGKPKQIFVDFFEVGAASSFRFVARRKKKER